MTRRCPPKTRRGFLWSAGAGIGSIALADLWARDEGFIPHHAPRARRVIQLFMSGAASQVDTFDHKPELAKRNGEKWDPGGKVELFQSSPGSTMASPWGWRRYGASGKHINDCVAALGGVVDEIAFIHSMVSESNVHGPATILQATGFARPGFPAAGAWVGHALGSLNENLPGFVVLPDPRGFAPNGPRNWSAGFLPASRQGTMIRPSSPEPVPDLFPPEGAVNARVERATRRVLDRLNADHAARRGGDSRLSARIRSYELAARMQLAAPEALDISREPRHVRRLYGLDVPNAGGKGPMDEGEETRHFGLNCLVARRLVERGVRYVQVWSGADNGHPRRNWDSHEDLARDHWPLGRGMARGAAALIRDLKARGLLDDTVVVWTTEFGRMPCAQGSLGRDHNPDGFTTWMAGGGIRGGSRYGATDEWGWKAVEDRATCDDVHATLLYLLGINHEALVFRHDGIDRRLTNVAGTVLHPILDG